MKGAGHLRPLDGDLDRILNRLGSSLEELRGRRLFITGGTGFFGLWLQEFLAWANMHMDLGVSAVLLTRDPDAFRQRYPHLAGNPAFHYHGGDITNFPYPEGKFGYILHGAATSAEATFRHEEPLAKFRTNALGTQRVMDFAVHCRADKVLYTSSGCIYGHQPAAVSHIPETYLGSPDPMEPAQGLGHGKRTAEFLCSAYAQKYGMEVKILRGFCFVGPFLQLDIQYAIGNFIRDAVRNVPIRVLGDGTQRRSYLYAADLMVWLWTIFLRGESCRPYNVGSERDLSIAELATLIKATLGSSQPVVVAGKAVEGTIPDRYVPCTQRARTELGLAEWTDLATAIQRTADYARCSTGYSFL